MNKLAVLNEIEVIDYSCSGGECEYVIAEDSAETIEKLHSVGLTDDQIAEAKSEYHPAEIDLSYIAFNFLGATWWNVNTGFGEDTQEGASSDGRSET